MADSSWQLVGTSDPPADAPATPQQSWMPAGTSEIVPSPIRQLDDPQDEESYQGWVRANLSKDQGPNKVSVPQFNVLGMGDQTVSVDSYGNGIGHDLRALWKNHSKPVPIPQQRQPEEVTPELLDRYATPELGRMTPESIYAKGQDPATLGFWDAPTEDEAAEGAGKRVWREADYTPPTLTDKVVGKSKQIMHDAVTSATDPQTYLDMLDPEKALDNAETTGVAALKGLGGSFHAAMKDANLLGGAFPVLYDKAHSLATGKDITDAQDAWFKSTVDPLKDQDEAFDLAKNAGFPDKVAHTFGSALGVISQAILTGGESQTLTALDSGGQAAKVAIEHGTKAMAVPATQSAIDTGQKVYQETGDADKALKAAQVQWLVTSASGYTPLSLEGGLVKRGVSGAVSGAATGEAGRVALNTQLPETLQTPYSAENLALEGTAGAVMGATGGPGTRETPAHGPETPTPGEMGAAADRAFGPKPSGPEPISKRLEQSADYSDPRNLYRDYEAAADAAKTKTDRQTGDAYQTADLSPARAQVQKFQQAADQAESAGDQKQADTLRDMADRLERTTGLSQAGPKPASAEGKRDVQAGKIALISHAAQDAGEIKVEAADEGHVVTVNDRRVATFKTQGAAEKAADDARQAVDDRRVDVATRKKTADMTPEEMQQELLTHPLTGIPNRRAYDESEKLPVQVSVDADSLKWINDSAAGHEGGDHLLKAIATALHHETPNAAHFGGDEFVVQAHDEAEAQQIMARVHERLAKATIHLEGPNGDQVTLNGIRISHGIGTSLSEADAHLRAEKSSKESAGLRAGRGEQPPNATITTARERLQDHGRAVAAGAETHVIHGQEVETPAVPTVEQAKAGNYKKGDFDYHGLPVKIENLPGQYREGIGSNGKHFKRRMKAAYGYFKGTKGADEDGIDVMIGNHPSDKAYVIDQLDHTGKKFDEHKVQVGVRSEEEARAQYLSHYPKDWRGLGSVTEMTNDELKEWLNTGDLSKPVNAKHSRLETSAKGRHSDNSSDTIAARLNAEKGQSNGEKLSSDINEKRTQIESQVRQVIDQFAIQPTDIVVVKSLADLRKNPEVGKFIEADKVQIALLHPRTGKLYFVADQIHSRSQVASLVAHEFIVHHGLRAAFGNSRAPQYQAILDGVKAALPNEVHRRGTQYLGDAYDPKKISHTNIAAEEALAYYNEKYMAGQSIPARIKRWLDQLHGMIRDWIRKVMGLPKKFDDLYVKRTMADLEAYLRRRPGTRAGPTTESEPAFAGHEDTSKEPTSLKGVPDRVATAIQNLRDVIVAEPFRSQGFGALQIPAQRRMLQSMFAAGQNPEVARIIIRAIPVPMMHILAAKDLTTENLFHHYPVFAKLWATKANMDVPLGIDVATAAVNAAALPTAEVQTVSGNLRLAPLTDLSTDGTMDSRHDINSPDEVLGAEDGETSSAPSIIDRNGEEIPHKIEVESASRNKAIANQYQPNAMSIKATRTDTGESLGHLVFQPSGAGYREITAEVGEKFRGLGLGTKILKAGIDYAHSEEKPWFSDTSLSPAQMSAYRKVAASGYDMDINRGVAGPDNRYGEAIHSDNGQPLVTVYPPTEGQPLFALHQERVASEIDEALAGKRREPVSFGPAPSALTSVGLPDRQIWMPAAVAIKARDEHYMTPGEIKSLPAHLADPLMVFDSATQPGRFVVLTKATTAEGPLLVVIEPNGRIAQISANVIASTYGKGNVAQIAKWIEGGLLRGAQKKSALRWLTTAGLRLPRVVQGLSKSANIRIAPNEQGGKSDDDQPMFALKEDHLPPAAPVKDEDTLFGKPGYGGKAYGLVRRGVVLAVKNPLTSDLQKLFNPASMDPFSEQTGQIATVFLGKLAQDRYQAQEHLQQFTRAINKMSPSQHLEMIDNIETGRPQSDPALQPIANAMRKLLDDWRDVVRGMGTGALENWIENYFPHIWKDETKAAALFSAIQGRSPMQGPKSFLKKRTIPTTKQGIEYGLTPLSTNPLILTLMKVWEMQKFVSGVSMMRGLKEAGLAKFVGAMEPRPPDWTKIDDASARVTKFSEEVGGLVHYGDYYMPTHAARIINNHLGRSKLSDIVAVQVFKRFSNTLNAVQLSFSGFHLGFTTLDAMISKGALGFERLIHGEPWMATKAFLEAATPAGAVFNVRRGLKLLRAYANPSGATPDMQAIVSALVAGGGRVHMDKYFLGTEGGTPFRGLGVRSLKSDIRLALTQPQHKVFAVTKALGSFPIEKAQEMWNGMQVMFRETPKLALPFEASGRIMRASSALIMEHIVPAQKLGVFSDLAADWLRRHPEATPQELAIGMQSIWRSVDNRLGEMVYDNLFWDRTYKDAMHLAFRAVGWNWGDYREIGGAPVDLLVLIDKGLRTGKITADDVGHKIPYTIAMLVTTAVIGGIIGYLYGRKPETPKDLMFPRTGTYDKDGTEQRVSLPSYGKDVYEYGMDPFGTTGHKLAPLWSTGYELWKNSDYFGHPIWNPDDDDATKFRDGMTFVAQQYRPFTFTNQRQFGDIPGWRGTALKVGSYVGITPAPGIVTKPEKIADFEHYREQKAWMDKLKYDLKKARSANDKAAIAEVQRKIQIAKQSAAVERQNYVRGKAKAAKESRERAQGKTSGLMDKVGPLIDAAASHQEMASNIERAGYPALAGLIASLPANLRPVMRSALQRETA